MWNFAYDNVTEIKTLMDSASLSMTKKRGQNFLINNHFRNLITRAITDSLNEGDTIWEIGPGLGSLTSLILKENKFKLKCFEIDYGFIRILHSAFDDEPSFSLVEGDALETVFKEEHTPWVVAGNLPYNVGTVLIAKMLERPLLPKRMVFTLQKEVAQRLAADDKSELWSSLSALRSISYDAKILCNITPSSFWPSPNVESSVVVLDKKDKVLLEEREYEAFVKFNRLFFSQKRKTIRNILSSSYKDSLEQAFKFANLSGTERSEKVSLDKIILLNKYFLENSLEEK